MLEFIIFAVVFVLSLLAFVIYLYPGSRRQTTVPGLDPSDTKEGNFADIISANSFHQFLDGLHQTFGSIASFWIFGPTLAVSICDETIIKSIDYMSEKPKEINQLFESFVGPKSILFAEKHDFRKQRPLWEQMFAKTSCESQSIVVKQMVSELIHKWSTIPETQHISVGHYMKAFTLRLSLISSFPEYFRQNSNDLIDFSRSFEKCFTELELRIAGDLSEDNSPRNQSFNQSVKVLRSFFEKAIQFSLNSKSKSILSPILTEESLDRQKAIDECMTYVLMFYSLSSALMWSLYFLGSDKELQNQVFKKLKHNSNNSFVDKVIESSISAANVIQWTSRVNPDVDIQLDKHLIPKQTPIICCLSYKSLNNIETDNAFEIFSKHLYANNNEKSILSFGSKGSKRCCPAEQYSKNVIKQLLIAVINEFTIDLIETDLIPKQIFRVYSKSEEEIWITIKKRINDSEDN